MEHVWKSSGMAAHKTRGTEYLSHDEDPDHPVPLCVVETAGVIQDAVRHSQPAFLPPLQHRVQCSTDRWFQGTLASKGKVVTLSVVN